VPLRTEGDLRVGLAVSEGCSLATGSETKGQTAKHRQSGHAAKGSLMLIRPLPFVLLIALALGLPVNAAAQSLPIGSLMNAIGRSQNAAPPPPVAIENGRRNNEKARSDTSRGRPGQVIRRERGRNGNEAIDYDNYREINRTNRSHRGNG